MTKLAILSCASFILIAFQTKKSKLPKYNAGYIEKNMCLIPAGSFNAGVCDDDQDVYLHHANRCRTVSISQFYMFNQEITNGFYVFYLNELKKLGDTLNYKAALPDTLVWRQKNSYNEPYVDYYLRHPAYANYPVVGLTYEQCLVFCQWLTQIYNKDPKRKFQNVKFDLPDSTQREWAAKGGLELSPFPWAGPFMQNSKGQWLANFAAMDQSSVHRKEVEIQTVFGKNEKVEFLSGYARGHSNYMGVAGFLYDNADITAPVLSYWPNAYGLYNMSGNVEEYIKSIGKTMGGSWRDTGYYLQNHVYESYDSTSRTSCERGFRIMMTVL